VADSFAGRHDLHVARLGSALVAQMIAVRDRAPADIGDDFHVAVAMGTEPGARLNRIVVPDQQRPETVARRVVVVGETEMVTCAQPVDVQPTQGLEGNNSDHSAASADSGRTAGRGLG
jgi:hypothetical protein